MARYEVKDVVCDYGIYEESELVLILNSKANALMIKEILEDDEKTGFPTKLFVPRSEVEEIVKFKDMAYAELRSYNEELKAKLDQAKQEVAEQIFEEIDKIIEEKYNRFVFKPQQYDSDEEVEAIVNYNDVIVDSLAELKKKYIKDKGE